MSQKELIKEYKNYLIQITGEFCDQYLDREYKEICQKLIEKMSRKRVAPFLSGRVEIWAAAIIYAIGSINFLFDPSFKPYISTDDLCNYFRTSKSTTAQKAKTIKDMFKLSHWGSKSREFLTNKIIEDNPLMSNVFLDGMPVPLEYLPEEIKEFALANPSKPIYNLEY